MIKLLSLLPFIEEFRWYRRRKGGKWFRIQLNIKNDYGPDQAIVWTQTPDLSTGKILKEENY